ncbi:MAG: hypothetical protein AB8B91_04155 [Rubripirellula sp.]
MRSVSRFESNLLRILQSLLGHIPVDQVLGAIAKPLPRPECLSRDAVELVKQMLGSGVVMRLTHDGAWAQQKHLRGDETREGSLWQRSRPEELGLEFSPVTMDFLIWLTTSTVTEPTTRWVVDPTLQLTRPNELLVGDLYFLHLAARRLRKVESLDRWYKHEPFRSNGLIALTMPGKFASGRNGPKPNFEPWMSGPGACVLEAMQDELADIWVEIEQRKSRVVTPKEMNRQGTVQDTILAAFFDAAEKHHRRDLARFLLQASQRLLNADTERSQWIGSLETNDLRLAERTEAYRTASAFLRACKRMGNWQKESVGIGYFDEGYPESQLWKSLWESTDGTNTLSHADRIIKELEF